MMSLEIQVQILGERRETIVMFLAELKMGEEAFFGPKSKLALAAALGTGVVLGATGIVVYQVRFCILPVLIVIFLPLSE